MTSRVKCKYANMHSGYVVSYECKSPNQQITSTNIKTAFKLSTTLLLAINSKNSFFDSYKEQHKDGTPYLQTRMPDGIRGDPWHSFTYGDNCSS
ncbi:Hypothetical predicted protein [Octopus vulgaris]|uniref:Uncharacterized protein n=1 Tax=Octopus vulgaris TaxID=6645 RepID=A0AA36EZM5_OCTVU|nr:Hypothetical predicted protein [Octopus vulgaris]